MSVTTVVREAARPAVKRQPTPVWRCQFCAQGHHRSCPRATRHNGVLWVCQCKAGNDDHHGIYCLECKHDHPGDLDIPNWVCQDRHACATRRKQRNDCNPVWRMIQAAKAHGALERKAKKLRREALLSMVDPLQEETISRVSALLDSINQLSRDAKPKKGGKASTPKPTSGSCECCGGVTKGGRFLPGHDARLASKLVQQAVGGDANALEELKARNWVKKIPAAKRASLGVEA